MNDLVSVLSLLIGIPSCIKALIWIYERLKKSEDVRGFFSHHGIRLSKIAMFAHSFIVFGVIATDIIFSSPETASNETLLIFFGLSILNLYLANKMSSDGKRISIATLTSEFVLLTIGVFLAISNFFVSNLRVLAGSITYLVVPGMIAIMSVSLTRSINLGKE